jgi:hypothetical protein
MTLRAVRSAAPEIASLSAALPPFRLPSCQPPSGHARYLRANNAKLNRSFEGTECPRIDSVGRFGGCSVPGQRAPLAGTVAMTGKDPEFEPYDSVP